MSTPYRAPMNFTWEGMDAAKSVVESFDAMCRNLAKDEAHSDRVEVADACATVARDFLAALRDDLNVSAALAAVHAFRSYVNRSGPYSPQDRVKVWTQIMS